MKNHFFISTAALGLLLSGCSSVYRTAQTPDDVYFSEGAVVAQADTRQNNNNNNSRRVDDSYSSYWEDQDDNMLRMKVRDRSRWGGIDDIDYWQGYNNGFWVGYNTFNSPWGWNNMGWNTWNNWGHPMMGWNSWNRPMGWNNGFGWNAGWGWHGGMGVGMMGMNNFGMGWNSWNNNWNNPWCWSRPVTVINRYPAGSANNPSRSASALSPYRNNTFSRGNTPVQSRGTVNNGTRSIWESPGMSSPTTNRQGSMFRSVERVGGGVDGGNRSFDRPVRTFSGSSGGSSGGGATMGGGSSGGGSSSGSSSRGGRGG